MKKKGKNQKGKFIDIDSFNELSNNKTMEKHNKIISGTEYKTPLEELEFLFPSFSSDLIEDIYISNQRNLTLTKKCLLEMQNDKENKNEDLFIDINKEYEIESYDNIKPFKNKKKKMEDITNLANFQYDNNNNDLNIKQNQKENDNNINNNDKYNEKNIITEEKNSNSKDDKKEKNDYISIFEIDNNSNNNNNTTPMNDDIIIEDYVMFDYYINTLKDIFPSFTREEITQRICDNDFDIDKTVLSFFENIPENTKLTDFDNFQISNTDEILSNFSTFNQYNENNIDIEAMIDNNVQKEIEDKIKNKSKPNKIFKNYEKECPLFTDDNKNKNNVENNFKENEEEEYFLDKPIKDIKTKGIRDALKRLSKAFPLEDEFIIKWVFYQFMDYNSSYQYLSNKNGNKTSGLKNLINSSNDKNVFYYDNSIKPKSIYKEIDDEEEEEEENNANPEEIRNFEIISKIISQNPEKWKLDENMENLNINEYQNIRKRLIYQALKSYSSKKYQDAHAIMARAKRYKQEINKIKEKKKVYIFMKNNKEHALGNLYNKNEHYIDLHGLSLEESKMIINKIFKTLSIKKEKENIKNMTLVIIVGVGKHSKNNKPVLLPGLISWLEIKNNYRFKVDNYNGIIRVSL